MAEASSHRFHVGLGLGELARSKELLSLTRLPDKLLHILTRKAIANQSRLM